MLTIDKGTKAYMAGIVDHLGIIRVREMKNTPPLPYVGINTANRQLADFMAGLTDAKVTEVTRKYNKMQCTEHCTPDAHTHVDSTTFRWSVTGVKATILLINLKPYLIFKSVQAADALKAGLEANYKPATYRKMKVLGWDIPDLSNFKGKRT